MPAIGQGVTLRGFYDEAKHFTFNISGVINRATDIGKVMTLDKTVANTAKLAGDGDVILGVLHSYEDRVQEGIKVGTVGLKDNVSIPVTGAIAIGDSVVGSATPGVAKKAVAANNTLVVEVGAGTAVVMFL